MSAVLRHLAATCLCLASTVSVSVAAPVYKVTDLGTINGGSKVNALNDLGYYTGGAGGSSVGTQTAFLSDASGIQDLGTLSLAQITPPYVATPSDTAYSWGQGVNSYGTVTGTSVYTSALTRKSISRGFIHDGTAMQDIGTLGGRNSVASAINDSGTVVGWSETSQVVPPGQATSGSPIVHAFIYKDGVMTDLGSSFGSYESHATAINASGWVTGSISTNYSRTAFIYDGKDLTLIPTGALHSTGNSINAQGWVAGTANNYGFIYKNGEMITLNAGLMYSQALGINDHGYVVGTATETTRAYGSLYDGQSILELNKLLDPESAQWYIREAFAINNAGQILAIGSYGFETRTLLLTPVPEPSMLALSIVGLGVMLLTVKRHTRTGSLAQ